ncbi:MAG: MFS transporter [Proteobacteria bacterium]|nr:MFS transporter [Pseudomonadota bacterium]
MLRAFRTIRAGERRDAWTAFAVLFGLIASHAVLETARDALFLSSVPASRLPWVYLAIAFFTLVLSRIQAHFASRLGGRAALSAWIAGSAAVTAVFWLFITHLGSSGLYALYVWSGVLTTLILVHFWTLLGDVFTITQAKRLYGFIGSGSVLGAIAGSGLAGALSQLVAPSQLLLISALGLAMTALIPVWMPRGDSSGTAPRGQGIGIADSVRFVRRERYAAGVALFVVISTAGLTFADYLFKSAVAASVPAEQLSTYFAAVYFALNLLSLFTQLFVIGWLLRRFDVITALVLLPVCLAVGAVGMLVVPGLIAAIVIKGADGGLRYSVHRTATELLYVPFTEHGRRLVKGFIEVIGQRGGQAVASIAILAITAATERPAILAALLLLCAVLWVVCAARIRRHYLDLFRKRVQGGQIEHLDAFPDLDLASLEGIVAALDSDNIAEVVAALDILEREGRDAFVPALTLYHPSEDVVVRALTIVARARRTRAAHATEHLLDHPSPRVRAAAAAAFSILTEDEQSLRMRLSAEESATVRATIRINLVASGAVIGSDASDAIDALVASGSTEAKVAMAHAVGWREAAGFEDLLIELTWTTEAAVRVAAIEAMARIKSPKFLPTLVDLLGHEGTRREAVRSLCAFGADLGLDALADALRDRSLPPSVRWQIPYALRAFPPAAAMPIALAALPDEPDGMVRYRLIRALEHLAQIDPSLRLGRTQRDAIDRTIADTVSRAYRYLDRYLILRAAGDENPARATQGHELLLVILTDKTRHAIDRLFRLLGLAYPTQPFDRIYRGLSGDSSERKRASSLELIENILRPPLRGAVVGLIDRIDEGERLAAGAAYHQPLRLSYQQVLATMLDSQSEIVKSVTVFHIGEIGLFELRDRVAELGRNDALSSDVDRALRLLDARPAQRPVAVDLTTDPGRADGGQRSSNAMPERGANGASHAD